MYLKRALTSVSLLLATASAVPAPSQTEATVSSTLPTEASTNTAIATSQINALLQNAIDTAMVAMNSSTGSQKRGSCTLANLSIRREWNTFSTSEKKAYISAVQCIQKKAPNAPADLVPGARSRFDDFVATHINQTLNIHYTGTFLAWHRYFTWVYEQALRTECGYTGTQPYWDWALTAVTGLETSAIFDGSNTSMSGNGAKIANQGNIILGGTDGLPEIVLPAGSGGGCVTSGPFKDMQVNLGPVELQITNGSTITNDHPLEYNPRCLKRDLTDYIIRTFANASSIASLILDSDDVYDFQMTMQGVPGSGNIGVHGGGHYAMGGDPGRDVYVSPGDPAFYLHHGMIDRTWWIWQMLDPATRLTEISGTNTFLNEPPSANTTLDTEVNLYYAGGTTMTMRDLMSTTAGPFCYIYL